MILLHAIDLIIVKCPIPRDALDRRVSFWHMDVSKTYAIQERFTIIIGKGYEHNVIYYMI